MTPSPSDSRPVRCLTRLSGFRLLGALLLAILLAPVTLLAAIALVASGEAP